uniref:Multi-sensor hybrid histidine kinase n=1 Tax=uncultured organism TaxID=155900 RepID=M1PVV1_9ZZZZ|nr:multi-sensor hybrid histidine kinase [uncultured organism]
MSRDPAHDFRDKRIEQLEAENARLAEANQALEKTLSSFGALFENSDDYILICDHRGSPMLWNSAYADIIKTIMGTEMQPGIKPHTLLPDENEIAWWENLHRRVLNGETFRTEYNYQIASDQTRYLEISYCPLYEDETIIGFSEISRDITARKQAEKALQESEAKYRILADRANDMIWIAYFRETAAPPVFEIDYVSPAVRRMTGYSPMGLKNKALSEILTPASYQHAMDTLAEALTSEQAGKRFPAQTVVLEHYCKNGTTIWLECNVSFLRDEEKNPIGIMGVSRDITEQLRIREELRKSKERYKKSEEKYRTIFENNGTPTFIVNADTTLALVNREAEKLLGYTKQEMEGRMSWRDFIVDPENMEKMQSFHDKRRQEPESAPRQYMARGRTKTGGIREVLFNVAMIPGTSQSLVSLLDLTDQRHLEKQLIEAQKMEAIGTLAGGVAHDFNNLLMGILGNVSVLMERSENDGFRQRLDYIEQYVQDGVQLTKQLLGFARGGKYEVEPVNVNTVIEKSATLFGRTHKEISIHFDFERQIRMVEADSNQIEQVLLNLYVNAWQAMPGGGDMYLSTQNVELDADFVKPFEVAPGRYACFSVTDTGIGMDEPTRQRAFDPFFTTRNKERGTGLGLASAYGIVKNHKGLIHVASKVNEGTTFTIYLPAAETTAPAADEAQDAEARDAEEAPKNEEILSGTETILLVDDEEMIRDVGREMLEGLGYRVLLADSGRQAVDTMSAHKDEIDLVILDFTMPEMSGAETFRRLQSVAPDLLVLVSSGYSLNDEVQAILQQGAKGFIQKPFNLERLSRKLREILAHPG